MIRKIVNNMKEYTIKDWSNIIDSDLTNAFTLELSHSLAIPITRKGILAGVTEDRVRKFTQSNVTSWYPKEPLGELTSTVILNPTIILSNHIFSSNMPPILNIDTHEYYNSPVYIVLDSKELDIKKFTRSLFDGKICSDIFVPQQTSYIVEGFTLEKIKIIDRYKESAKALRFIFLYDKKREKIAEVLTRLIDDIYEDC